MKKPKITYTRHHKGVRTKTYRNRTIVTDYSYGENKDLWLKEGKGTSQVFDAENNPVTPALPCSLSNDVDNDYYVTYYYYGWVLLGDFIFLQGSNFSL